MTAQNANHPRAWGGAWASPTVRPDITKMAEQVLARIRRRCYTQFVKVKVLLTRILSILATVGFLVAPMITPSAGAATPVGLGAAVEMAGMEMGGADRSADATSVAAGPVHCCSPQNQHLPDCPKDCPWAALCVAKCFAQAASLNDHAALLSWIPATIPSGRDRNRDRMPEPPPPRPPRT